MFLKPEDRQHGEAPAKVLDEASLLLLKAAELIQRHGHTKHDLGSCSRGFCITGALFEVKAGGTEAWQRLAVAFGGSGLGWVHWNNAPERTAAEVVAKLREVALG